MSIRNSLYNAREDDRINQTSRIDYQISFDEETNDAVIARLSEEGVPLDQRMQEFTEFCGKFRFILTEKQADFLIQLVASAKEAENDELANIFLYAICDVFQFKEEFNNELFIEKERLDVIMSCFPLCNAYTAASYLVSLNVESAKTIWEYNEDINFKSLVYRVDSEQSTPVSPDQALAFLSSFLKYPDFADEMMEINDCAIKLWMVSDSDSRIRYEILRFVYYSIKASEPIANFLLENDTFYTLFQSPPESQEHHIIILKVLRKLCEQTKNPERAIIASNLLPFIYITIKSQYDNVVSYGCDLLGEVAEKTSPEGFGTLMSLNFIDELWTTTNERSMQCNICALDALFRFFSNGPDEIKADFIEKGFFTQFANVITVFDDKRVYNDLVLMHSMIADAQTEENMMIIEAIFGNEDLVDALKELNDSDSFAENVNIIANGILSRA